MLVAEREGEHVVPPAERRVRPEDFREGHAVLKDAEVLLGVQPQLVERPQTGEAAGDDGRIVDPVERRGVADLARRREGGVDRGDVGECEGAVEASVLEDGEGPEREAELKRPPVV